jgi:D-glycero-alpha-D-manno-heptose-7-phosphate kinase
MRVSYVGGGSDYESFFTLNRGNVLGAAINQYIYIFCNQLSEIAKEKVRFTYRRTESVSDFSEIEHPVLREMLLDLKWQSRINIGTFSELPAGVGLGGSSAFTVGLAKLLIAQSGGSISDENLAAYATRIERKLLKEAGGIQDQLHSAHGGFNHFSISGKTPEISKNEMPRTFSDYVEKRQLLVWVGSPRESAIHAGITENAIAKDYSNILESSVIASKASEDIRATSNESERFEILFSAVKQGWDNKRKYISNVHENVNEIEETAYLAGASAVKLCGAGESGFMLVLFQEEKFEILREKLSRFSIIFPKIDHEGTTLLHQDF